MFTRTLASYTIVAWQHTSKQLQYAICPLEILLGPLQDGVARELRFQIASGHDMDRQQSGIAS